MTIKTGNKKQWQRIGIMCKAISMLTNSVMFDSTRIMPKEYIERLYTMGDKLTIFRSQAEGRMFASDHIRNDNVFYGRQPVIEITMRDDQGRLIDRFEVR